MNMNELFTIWLRNGIDLLYGRVDNKHLLVTVCPITEKQHATPHIPMIIICLVVTFLPVSHQIIKSWIQPPATHSPFFVSIDVFCTLQVTVKTPIGHLHNSSPNSMPGTGSMVLFFHTNRCPSEAIKASRRSLYWVFIEL